MSDLHARVVGESANCATISDPMSNYLFNVSNATLAEMLPTG